MILILREDAARRLCFFASSAQSLSSLAPLFFQVVGRLWTVTLAVLSILWLPVLEQVQGSEFWDYTQAISSYLLPPIVMVFLCGIFWPRCTEPVSGTGTTMAQGDTGHTAIESGTL